MKKLALAAITASALAAMPAVAEETAKPAADPFVSTQGGLAMGGAGAAAIAITTVAIFLAASEGT